MKAILIGFFIFMIFQSTAYPGRIYGTLKKAGKVIPELEVLVTFADDTQFVGKTDEHGSYRVNVKKTGSCTFSVKNHTGATYKVHSYKTPVRYDFDLIKAKKGFKLERKK